LSVRQTVLVPHPHNASFAAATTDAYNKVGLKQQFVETWDYAHSGDGNLHCSTHAIPFCRKETRRGR
jgi:hypothetical protein